MPSVQEYLSNLANVQSDTQQKVANTQLINARVPYEQAATQDLLQNMDIAKQNQAQVQAARQQAMGWLLTNSPTQENTLSQIEGQTDIQQRQAQSQGQDIANGRRDQIIQGIAAGPIGSNNPQTPSYNENKAIKQSPVDAEVQQLQNDATFAKAMVAATMGTKDQGVWKDIYDNTNTNLRQATQKKQEQDAKKVKEISGLFPDVKSGEDLNNRLQFVHEQYPEAWPKIASMFNADPKDPSQFLYDKKALNSITGLTNQAASYEDRVKMADAQARIAETKSRDAETARRNREAEFDRDQKAADAQAARADADRLRKDTKAESAGQRALTQLQTISGSYNNNQPVKEFQTLKSAYTAQEKYLFTGNVGPDGKPEHTPSSSQDSVGDQALTDAYLKLVHPQYKGSVYELKEMKSFPGIPTRVWQGLKNLWIGGELPPDIRYDMFRTMSRQFKEQNDQQIEREDSNLAKVGNFKKYLPPEVDVSSYIPQYAIRPQRGADANPAPKVTSRQPGATNSDTAPDGSTATNPTTGEKLIKRNGQWAPVQ